MACVHNFTPNYYNDYFVRLGNVKEIREVFSTDREEYGGSGKINAHINVHQPHGFTTQLAPLATMIFEVQFE